MYKVLLFVGLIVIAFGGGFLVSSGFGREKTGEVKNVSIEDGVQIVSIQAAGGYAPRISEAKSGLPTTIRISTKNALDCSSFVLIPQIGYKSQLSPNSATDIQIPAQNPNSTIQGICSMGMYAFNIKFI